jgi:hypothetical protein
VPDVQDVGVNGGGQLMLPAQSASIKGPWVAQVRRNVDFGWCPCGDEADGDCECFGVYRLAVAQGAIEPSREREGQAS